MENMRKIIEEDETGDRWYVRTAPRTGHRSKDAYIRERLRKRRKEVDRKIDQALWSSPIKISTLAKANSENNTEQRIQALSASAGVCIIEVLIDECAKEGGLGRIDARGHREGQPYRTWGPQARAHAQRWIEAQAPKTHWDSIIKVIQHAHSESDSGTVWMRCIIEIVRKGPEIAQKMMRCDPWVIREACWRIPKKTLDEDEKRWAIQAVHLYGKIIGIEHKITDRDALEALQHWRWPTMQPPLAIVAAGAGRMAPLCSDSAWANAMNGTWGVEWKTTGTSIQERRRNENKSADKAMKKVADIAHTIVEKKHGGKTSAIIDRWREKWRKNDKIEGDGSIGVPRLETIGDKSKEKMMWVFDVHGPEVLLAGWAIERKNIEDGIDIYDMNRLSLALTIEKDGGQGNLFERETGDRPTKFVTWVWRFSEK